MNVFSFCYHQRLNNNYLTVKVVSTKLSTILHSNGVAMWHIRYCIMSVIRVVQIQFMHLAITCINRETLLDRIYFNYMRCTFIIMLRLNLQQAFISTPLFYLAERNSGFCFSIATLCEIQRAS